MFLASVFVLAVLEVRASNDNSLPIGNFLRSTNETAKTVPLNLQSFWMDGITHYRLLPGVFPAGMHYQFDGLATVMKFSFTKNELTYTNVRFESNLEKYYGNCMYEGTGTGPTVGLHSCLTNPGVNLLPINDQLWLTIDTSGWGRIDPDTLATVSAKAEVPSTVLNAHPACDASTKECYVQYPCSALPGPSAPVTNLACVGILQTGDTDIKVAKISQLKLPKAKLIQHSHSPCITPNFLVSKLDSFAKRDTPAAKDAGGILKVLHQYEDDMWLVMDRRTNVSRLLYSNVSFVNNHFWNCVERDNKIVVDTVAATGNYLDAYFKSNLQRPTNWTNMFYRPQRCLIALEGDNIECTDLLTDADSSVLFDYPTFNPYFKMNPEYQYTYGIAPVSPGSQWFDRLLKLNASGGHIITQWSEKGTYLTEATFIPRSAEGQEDDGVLASIIYRSSTDSSSLALFNAADLKLVDEYQLDQVVPFHAHGISCNSAINRCFTNP